MIPRVLTIAGSDAGGGSGIQGDLKTFTVLGTYGLSVITALTAQNTLGVQAIADVEARFVAAQLDSVLGDIGADAVKTGMMNTREVIEVVADALERYKVPHIVVDPVMIAKSGHRLLREDAVRVMKERLLPLASVVTPNIEEAAILADIPPIEDARGMGEAAKEIVALGARAVIVKGGHLLGDTSDDLWFNGKEMVMLSSPRFDKRHTHGTGCAFSAALAAYLAKGLYFIEATRYAKNFVSEAIRTAESIGSGNSPVNHLWQKTVKTSIG